MGNKGDTLNTLAAVVMQRLAALPVRQEVKSSKQNLCFNINQDSEVNLGEDGHLEISWEVKSGRRYFDNITY